MSRGPISVLLRKALILVGTLVVDLPRTFHIVTTAATAAERATDVAHSFWAPFVALAGGLVAAALGGALAGQTRRTWGPGPGGDHRRPRAMWPGPGQPVAG